MPLTGRCYCGNLSLEFDTALSPAALPLRVCQCSFCRAHGAVTTSDPAGQVSIRAEDREQVRRYRFGLGITDFILCRRCGIYLLALMEIDGKPYAVINSNVLDCRGELRGEPDPKDYDDEDAATRTARRKARWTPVVALDGF